MVTRDTKVELQEGKTRLSGQTFKSSAFDPARGIVINLTVSHTGRSGHVSASSWEDLNETIRQLQFISDELKKEDTKI